MQQLIVYVAHIVVGIFAFVLYLGARGRIIEEFEYYRYIDVSMLIIIVIIIIACINMQNSRDKKDKQ